MVFKVEEESKKKYWKSLIKSGIKKKGMIQEKKK